MNGVAATPRHPLRHWVWLPALLGVCLVVAMLLAQHFLPVVLAQLEARIPGLDIAPPEGNLAEGWEIPRLHYSSAYEDITVTQLSIRLNPLCLLNQRVCISRLGVAKIDWKLLKSRDDSEFDFPAVSLPPISLPVNVSLDDVQIDRFLMKGDAVDLDITDGRLRAHTDQQRLIIEQLHTQWNFTDLRIDGSLDGNIDLSGTQPVNLSTHVLLDFAETKDLDITATLRGPALNPTINGETHGLVEASAEVQASFAAKGWPVSGHAVQRQPLRLDGDSLTLRDAAADISGTVVHYRVDGTTRLTGIPGAPDLDGHIITDGGFFGLDAITLKAWPDKKQSVTYTGRFDWYPRLAWKGRLDTDGLDAGFWVPGVHTRLKGGMNVRGDWWPGEPYRLTVDDLAATGTWQDLPARVKAAFSLHNMDLDISELRASIGTNTFDANGHIARDWALKAQLDAPALARLLPSVDGSLQARAMLSGPRATPTVKLDAQTPQLAINGFTLNDVHALLDGNLSAHTLDVHGSMAGYHLDATGQGRYDAARWNLGLESATLAFGDHTARLSSPAQASLALDRLWLEVPRLCLANERENACATTRLRLDTLDGTAAVDATTVDPRWLGVVLQNFRGHAGRWSGTASITLARASVREVRWDATAHDVHLDSVAGQGYNAPIDMKQVQSRGDLTGRHLQLDAKGTRENGSTLSGRLDMPDLNAPSTLTFAVDGDAIPLAWITPWLNGIVSRQGDIAATLEGEIHEGWPTLKGKATLSHAELELGGSGNADILDGALDLDARGSHVTIGAHLRDPQGTHWFLMEPIQLDIDSPHRRWHLVNACAGNDSGKLCATGRFDPREGIALDAEAEGNINPWLTPFLDEGVWLDGPFKGTIHLTQPEGKWAGNARLESQLTAHSGRKEGAGDTRGMVTIDAHLADDQLATHASLKADTQGGSAGGTIEARLRTPLAGTRDIEGGLTAHTFDLAVLAPLFPSLSTLRGRLDGQVDITGTLRAPHTHGQLRVSHGKISSTRFPLTVKRFDAEAQLADTRATLNARLSNGRGKGTLTSSADWTTGTLITDTHLVTTNYPVKRGADVDVRFDSDCRLTSAGAGMDLKGLVRLNEGFIRVARLPQSAVRESRDVIFVDEEGEHHEDTPLNMTVNLAVETTNLLQIDALGATVRMHGGVLVSQTPGTDPTGKGSFTIDEGTYTGYGQKLRISKGQIIFSGPIDNPVLAITAVRQVGTVEAGLNISGNAQQPESHLFASESGLSDQDILTYIVTGRAPADNGTDNRTAVNSAIVSLGLSGSEDYARDFASRAGIQDLQISTSSFQQNPYAEVQNSFNVGGYVSPKLYLQYGVGINSPVNTFTARYRLSQNVFLEALSGLENALDVLYSFEVE